MTSDRLENIRKYMTINKKKSLINRHTNISDILDDSVSKLYDILETISLGEIHIVYNKYFLDASSTFVKVDDKNY